MQLWFILTLALGLPITYLIGIGVSFVFFERSFYDPVNAWCAAIFWPLTVPVAIAIIVVKFIF